MIRVAIYYAPAPEHPLARRAVAWLGRDAAGGAVPPRPLVAGLGPQEAAALTQAPCRYGFHATLKAPFRLAAGTDLEALDTALAVFAAATPPAPLPPLAVRRMDDFYALAPVGPAPQAAALAAATVRHFEPFRAPLAAAERDRRAAGLTPRQVALLDAWGYPYVLDEYRFHMTLTGAVAADRHGAVAVALSELFGDVADLPLAVDNLALFVELEPQAPFYLHARHPLAAAADRAVA